MQVKETKTEGLKREFAVTLDAKTVNEEIETQLRSMGSRVKIPGFRPGHIPMAVLKKRFGKNVLGEVVERTVNQSSQRILRDKTLRPAMPPKIEIISYEEGGDLDFRMELEVMPEVPAMDFSKIKLEKLVCDVSEDEIDEAIGRLLERNKVYTRTDKGTKAEKGHQLLMDFVGKIDGVAFEGGSAKGFQLVLGSGQFIEGFEDQLIGAKEGEEVVVNVTFPAAYHKEDLANKPAEFTVTVHEVREGGNKTEATDEFAKTLGFTDVAGLRKAVHDQFAGDYQAAARGHMKKQLFDQLEKDCDFVTPQGMLDLEFNSIWEKIQQAKKEGDEVLKAKSDEALREEYMKIAQRRIKLGILLSDVAAKNKITINQDELSNAVMQQASQYPGQERKVFEFYQKNPQHLEELRGPILEEKAVDFIIGKSKLTERKVTREELMSETEESDSSEEKSKKKAAGKPKKKAANE
jgi:trigger factor